MLLFLKTNGGLCNGSTTDSDSVSRGSNPLPPAKSINDLYINTHGYKSLLYSIVLCYTLLLSAFSCDVLRPVGKKGKTYKPEKWSFNIA